MTVGLDHYLVVSAVLFCLGLLGVVTRRSLIVMYMGLELMLNAANLALVAFRRAVRCRSPPSATTTRPVGP